MSILSIECRHEFPGGFRLDVALEIAHRFTALCGPSGSGKTTILNMIAGFVRPQTARIRFGAHVLVDTARGVCLPPERRGIGIVPQDSRLFPHLSVAGNLYYGHRRRGRLGPRDFARIVEMLEIGPLLKRSPRNLSGGERQRLALGRAILSGPDLLLMDEPLAALDADLGAGILDYLRRVIAQWNLPTLFVTHRQADVRRAAQWVVAIDRGRVVSQGRAEDDGADTIAQEFTGH